MRGPESVGVPSRGEALFLVMALTALVAVGCDSRIDVRAPQITLPTAPTPTVTPAGATVSEVRPIAGVDTVSLDAVGLVEIALGQAESLIITAPASVMPLLTSRVEGGRLVLGRDSASYQGQVSDIRYEVGLRRLDGLVLEGVGEINALGVDAVELRVRNAGVGQVRAAGRADVQDVQMSGLGDYLAQELETRVTRVDIASGDAVVWATERIEGWVGPGCTLEYHGDPVVEVSGGGVVRKIGFGS